MNKSLSRRKSLPGEDTSRKRIDPMRRPTHGRRAGGTITARQRRNKRNKRVHEPELDSGSQARAVTFSYNADGRFTFIS
jgi:hypothetical protein